MLRRGNTGQWRFGERRSQENGSKKVYGLFDHLEYRLGDYVIKKNIGAKSTDETIQVLVRDYYGEGVDEYAGYLWSKIIEPNFPIRPGLLKPQYDMVLEVGSDIDTKTRRPIAETMVWAEGDDIELTDDVKIELAERLPEKMAGGYILTKAAQIHVGMKMQAFRYGTSFELEGIVRDINYLSAAIILPATLHRGNKRNAPPFVIRPILVSTSKWDDDIEIRDGKTSLQIVEDYIEHESSSRAEAYRLTVQALLGVYPAGLPGISPRS